MLYCINILSLYLCFFFNECYINIPVVFIGLHMFFVIFKNEYVRRLHNFVLKALLNPTKTKLK